MGIFVTYPVSANGQAVEFGNADAWHRAFKAYVRVYSGEPYAMTCLWERS